MVTKYETEKMNQSNKKKHIIFPVEVKRRELLSRLLIAAHCVEQGYSVIIGDKMGCHYETEHLSNCIYLAKSLSIDLQPVFSQIKEKNGKILVLFEEGGYVIRENNKNAEIKSFYPESMLPFVDTLMTYGKSYQDLLIENFQGLNISNTYVSGNARFDLHKPKFSSLFSEKVNKIKAKYGKYILINTNFGLANHLLGQEFIINEFKNSNDFTPELKEYYINLQQNQIKEHEDFSKMVIDIAKKFPMYTFIVRPHIIESKQYYETLYTNISNISVTNEGTATPWIIGSELIIHKDCTTGIESSFTNKPVISYLSSDDPDIFWLPPLVSDIARNIDEMEIKLKEYLIDKKEYILNSKNKKIVAREIVNINADSTFLFINLINSLKESSNLTNESTEGVTTIFQKNSFLTKLYHRSKMFYWWYKSKYITKNIYSISFEGLTKKEITNLLDKIIIIEKLDFKYKIIQKSVNTFLIEKI